MIRRIVSLLVLVLCCSTFAQGQQCRLSGTVRDAKSGEPLAFAHIYIKDVNAGTTSDGKGRYTMPVQCGTYKVRASYMGYTSAFKSVTVSDTSAQLEFALRSSTIEFPEITVVPGENPAIPIIKKAIAAKRVVEQKLQRYSVDAHTKLRAGNAVIEAEGFDAKALEDAGIVFVAETHSTAYWSREAGIKEVIHARKQAVVNGQVYNMLNSMPARTNFSADVIDVGKDITGPISEDGLDDYWYELKGTTVYDGEKVYVIDVHPESELAPRMDGTIYIQDSTYLLMMVDTRFTEPVFGPYMPDLRFRQQFTNADGFWMPADVSMTGKFRGAVMVKFSLDVELFSILKDYQINDAGIDENIDDFIIEVAKDADDIDSLAWQATSFIPRAEDEVHVYSRTDSLEIEQKEDRESYSFGEVFNGTALEYGETVYVLPGLFEMYRFNKIQGHTLGVDFGIRKLFEPVDWITAAAEYGFSDERFRWSLGSTLGLHQATSLNLTLRAYDKLSYIDPPSYVLGPFAGLVAQAAFMYDPRDFFYQKGEEASIGMYVLPTIHTTLSASYDEYTSAKVNTNEHLFRSNRPWPANPAINDGSIATVGLDVFYDGRVRILNKGVVERHGAATFAPRAGVNMNMVESNGDNWTYYTASAMLRGAFGLGGWGDMEYRITGDYADTRVPTQRLFYLTGSTEGVTGPWLFRSALPREFGGDARATAMAHWNLGNLPFRALGVPNIPYVNNLYWEVTIFGNAGWTDMRGSTERILTVPTERARLPFYELGFSVGNIFGILQLDFAWRMNHYIDGHNFFWGISIAPGSFFGK